MNNNYLSLNQKFKDSEFHHLHINDNHYLGLYIPKKLHRDNKHGKWQQDISCLKKANKAALLWLCEQSIIQGDNFTTFVPVREWWRS